jgi:hypothetical protein
VQILGSTFRIGEAGDAVSFLAQEGFSMLMMKERRPAIRTLQGWAISVLLDAGAIRECEEHGWMKDCGDPDARERAPRRRPPGSTVRRLSGRGSRCGGGRTRLNRRHVPGVSARSLTLGGGVGLVVRHSRF